MIKRIGLNLVNSKNVFKSNSNYDFNPIHARAREGGRALL